MKEKKQLAFENQKTQDDEEICISWLNNENNVNDEVNDKVEVEQENNSDDVDMDKLWEKLRAQEISKSSSITKENKIENKIDTDKVLESS